MLNIQPIYKHRLLSHKHFKNTKPQFYHRLFLPYLLIFLLGFLLPNATLSAQCNAIQNIDFVAHNPDYPEVHYGDGSSTFVKNQLKAEDYQCFEVVPFLIKLEVRPEAECVDYQAVLGLEWMCNTTGQGGIGVTEIVGFRLNDSSDPGTANLDGNEIIANPDYFTISGNPLGDTNGSCKLDATYVVGGLDPGDIVVVRVDVLLDCDLTAHPTGMIKAKLTNASIVSGIGSDCTCDNLREGRQTITWKVDLPECFCTTAPELICPPDLIIDNCISDLADFPTLPVPNPNLVGIQSPHECEVMVVFKEDSDIIVDGCLAYVERTYSAVNVCHPSGDVPLSSFCTHRFTINYDPKLPELICPPDYTVQCSTEIPRCNPDDAIVTDNCDGNVSITCEQSTLFDSECEGTIVNTYTAIDACGNTSNCKQVIEVLDITAPTIICPPDMTIQCSIDLPLCTENDAIAMDNCDMDLDKFCLFSSIFGNECDGMIVRVYTATDDCGNTTNCEQIIDVEDKTPPTIVCPPDVTVQCVADVPPCNPYEVTATENCYMYIELSCEQGPLVGDDCNGTIINTYTAADYCGNKSNCEQTIHIRRSSNLTMGDGINSGEENSLSIIQTLNMPPTDNVIPSSIEVEENRSFTMSDTQKQNSTPLDFTIFPNPAKAHTVYLQLQDFVGQNIGIYIVNARGETVFLENRKHLDTSIVELDIARWSSGIYIVQIIGKKGVTARKLIVTSP